MPFPHQWRDVAELDETLFGGGIVGKAGSKKGIAAESCWYLILRWRQTSRSDVDGAGRRLVAPLRRTLISSRYVRQESIYFLACTPLS